MGGLGGARVLQRSGPAGEVADASARKGALHIILKSQAYQRGRIDWLLSHDRSCLERCPSAVNIVATVLPQSQLQREHADGRLYRSFVGRS